MNLEIIETHRKTSIWPRKDNAMLVTCIDGSGKKYKAELYIAEYNLSVFIQRLTTEYNLSALVQQQLVNLIDAYGEECYEKADTDNSIANAGEDI